MEKSEKKNEKKGFLSKLIESFDKKLEQKAKQSTCCCAKSKNSKDGSCSS